MQKYIYCVEKALCSSAAIYSCIYCIFISCKYRPHMERISCFESYIFRSNLCNWTSFTGDRLCAKLLFFCLFSCCIFIPFLHRLAF